MMRSTLVLALMCGYLTTYAQVFPGNHSSHYSGVYHNLFNPGLTAGTPFRWDVNIIGGDLQAGNNYFNIRKETLGQNQWRKNQDFWTDSTTMGKAHLRGSFELLMPSVLYSIDERQTASFIWRIRSQVNAGGIETSLMNLFSSNFNNPQYYNRSFQMPVAMGSSHIWNEFGFGYARTIMNNGSHRVKVGGTLKILSGQASGYLRIQDLGFEVLDPDQVQIKGGSVQWAYNTELDQLQDESPLSQFNPFQNIGIGLDVGVVWEWLDIDDYYADSYAVQEQSWNADARSYKLASV
jgi:hypothetical protein